MQRFRDVKFSDVLWKDGSFFTVTCPGENGNLYVRTSDRSDSGYPVVLSREQQEELWLRLGESLGKTVVQEPPKAKPWEDI